MKPFRQINKREVTYDPDTGKDREWQLEQSRHARLGDGCIDTDEIVRKSFKDCGCDGDIGGRCFKCGAVSCKSCHGRCNKCQQPICMQHSNFLEKDDGDKIRLCGPCCEALVRKRRTARIRGFLLSFFIEEKNDD